VKIERRGKGRERGKRCRPNDSRGEVIGEVAYYDLRYYISIVQY